MPTVWFSTKYFQHAVCLGISRGVYFSIALTALFLKKFIRSQLVCPKLHFHKQGLVVNCI